MSSKILTVDDSRMARMIVAKTFQPHGCEVYEAANGAEALATAAAITPDLIFLDITMADMNGLEVLAELRKIEALAATPVIMLSAESGNYAIERADQLKVVGYIAKPFKGAQLLAAATPFLHLQPVATP